MSQLHPYIQPFSFYSWLALKQDAGIATNPGLYLFLGYISYYRFQPNFPIVSSCSLISGLSCKPPYTASTLSLPYSPSFHYLRIFWYFEQFFSTLKFLNEHTFCVLTWENGLFNATSLIFSVGDISIIWSQSLTELTDEIIIFIFTSNHFHEQDRRVRLRSHLGEPWLLDWCLYFSFTHHWRVAMVLEQEHMIRSHFMKISLQW